MLTFSACQETKNSPQSNSKDLENPSSNIPDTDTSDTLKRTLSSGAVINADVEIPEGLGDSVSVYSANLLQLDVDNIVNIFLNDKEITDKTEAPSEEDMGDGRFLSYMTADGSTLVTNGALNANYSSAEFQSVQLDYGLEQANQANLSEDFSFKTREEAAKEVIIFLDNMGVSVHPDYKCYSLNYQYLEQNNSDQADELSKEESAGIQPEILWNEELNCYYFRFTEQINGIPVTEEFRDEKDELIPVPEITVVYSKRGIEVLEISSIYETSNPKNASILDLDTALTKLDQKFKSVIIEGSYTITKIRLEYIPIKSSDAGEYRIIPAWRFYAEHTFASADKEDPNQTITDTIKEQFLFDAVSGDEIMTGVGI